MGGYVMWEPRARNTRPMQQYGRREAGACLPSQGGLEQPKEAQGRRRCDSGQGSGDRVRGEAILVHGKLEWLGPRDSE
jgi:hypothetical protein